jgi:SAM-dependent methyltransferase
MERVINQALFVVYGFDIWHITNGGRCRPYKLIIADKINQLSPDNATVVEVGCGLGDILRHVKSANRIGCDIDHRVIRAARMRALFHNVVLRVGDSTVISESAIDVLIMVNWIHTLSPSDLSELVAPFLPRTKYFLFDSIDEESLSSYKYGHDFQFMRHRASLVETFRVFGEPRSFLIWKSKSICR